MIKFGVSQLDLELSSGSGMKLYGHKDPHRPCKFFEQRTPQKLRPF